MAVRGPVVRRAEGHKVPGKDSVKKTQGVERRGRKKKRGPNGAPWSKTRLGDLKRKGASVGLKYH